MKMKKLLATLALAIAMLAIVSYEYYYTTEKLNELESKIEDAHIRIIAIAESIGDANAPARFGRIEKNMKILSEYMRDVRFPVSVGGGFGSINPDGSIKLSTPIYEHCEPYIRALALCGLPGAEQ